MIEERLAAFAHAPLDGAPEDVFRLSLLDWAACGIAGRAEPVAAVMSRAAEGRGECTALRGRRLPPRAAALLNGTVSHALDYDDTHFAHVGHPSVAVIPAALAVAETVGADARGFRDAALMGMEASVRVGVWLGRAHYEAGFHQTATAGAIGAALACARLMGLSEADTRHALGAVSTMASGLKSQFGTMGKPLNAGIGAAAGVEAARLVGAGLLSNPAGLSGPQGFGAAHHAEAAEMPGGRWLMADVSHKLHACCHGLHAMLEALRDMRWSDEIDHVSIRTNPRWLAVCDKPEPATSLEAKFSYRLTAAMALAGRDTAALTTYSDEATRDSELVRIRDRVRVIGDPAMSDTQVVVEIGNARLAHDLSGPIPLAERTARVRTKAEALVGTNTAGRLWEATGRDDLSAMTSLLQDAVS